MEKFNPENPPEMKKEQPEAMPVVPNALLDGAVSALHGEYLDKGGKVIADARQALDERSQPVTA